MMFKEWKEGDTSVESEDYFVIIQNDCRMKKTRFWEQVPNATDLIQVSVIQHTKLRDGENLRIIGEM